MRSPSTFMQSHGWWLDAVAGREPPRHDGLPECGYFRMQHVKNGPYVPVRVTLSQDIDHDTGELAAPERHIATYEGRTIDAALIWDRLDPISRDEYEQLVEVISRDDRMAASMVALDLSETPTRPPKGTRR
jgi:hypothetical protein